MTAARTHTGGASPDFDVIIPARYGATRLPGKPLIEIAGKPLIEWVYEAARRSSARRVVIATDDQRIADAMVCRGAEVCITDARHRSGTDRIAEAAAALALAEDRILVNLQGDEPLMPAALIDGVARTLAGSPQAAIATAAHTIRETGEHTDPNVVKVVCDRRGLALYFSRAPIPCSRDGGGVAPRRHIGIYAYRAGFVRRFADWSPTALEQTECLEQLRALEHGARIAVMNTDIDPGPGIDTQADLQRFRELVNDGK